jgi:hypothetical protein
VKCPLISVPQETLAFARDSDFSARTHFWLMLRVQSFPLVRWFGYSDSGSGVVLSREHGCPPTPPPSFSLQPSQSWSLLRAEIEDFPIMLWSEEVHTELYVRIPIKLDELDLPPFPHHLLAPIPSSAHTHFALSAPIVRHARLQVPLHLGPAFPQHDGPLGLGVRYCPSPACPGRHLRQRQPQPPS